MLYHPASAARRAPLRWRRKPRADRWKALRELLRSTATPERATLLERMD